ncbi:MAG: hypothetical protein HUJ30_04060 [Gammaproteobacteria bacterium]|nr:hypothetical protein [Gammaproteobacteria bacterium]
MDSHTINVDIIRNAILDSKHQGKTTITTHEVIQKYHHDYGNELLAISTGSFNSIFGKLLREKEQDLGIRYVREVMLDDTNKKPSTEWVIL